MRSYRFILSVQGEGRGHLTQAIAIYELLRKSGHSISCVTVGISNERQIPDFFIRKINVPIIRLASPNFVKDNNKRSISLPRTISSNMLMMGEYRKSLLTIKKITDEYQPDIVINFYEPLIGWYSLRYQHSFKIISIAHQYTYLHPSYRFPPGNRIQSFITRYYTKFTATGSRKILAISMHDMPETANQKLVVIPPILRKELFQQEAKQEDFILVYLLNSGYIADILKWHKKHPSTVLYCFTDSAEVKNEHKGEWKINDNLVFYSLNDHKFLEMIARCKGLVCNAGFESVCEAMYLGKPVMMVPVKGHYEQYCNALDGSKAGAGIYSEEFNLGKMEHYFLFHKNQRKEPYLAWVNQMESMVLSAIESVFSTEKGAENTVSFPANRVQSVKQHYIDQLTDPSFSSFKDMPST